MIAVPPHTMYTAMERTYQSGGVLLCSATDDGMDLETGIDIEKRRPIVNPQLLSSQGSCCLTR